MILFPVQCASSRLTTQLPASICEAYRVPNVDYEDHRITRLHVKDSGCMSPGYEISVNCKKKTELTSRRYCFTATTQN